MVPWIQVFSNLPDNRKVGTAADLLGSEDVFVTPETMVVGIMVSLWCWAVQNAPEGDLSNVPARTLARACGWSGNPARLKEILLSSGFLDDDGKIHDWQDYCLIYLSEQERKAKMNRDRVARYRNNKSGFFNIDESGTDYDALAKKSQQELSDKYENRSS